MRLLSVCVPCLSVSQIMEVREEVLDILHRVWAKLQGLPEANSLEIGAFFILLLFVGEFGRHPDNHLVCVSQASVES